MSKMSRKVIILVVAIMGLVTAKQSFAQSLIIGDINYAGTGCSSENAQKTIRINQQGRVVLGLKLNNFVAIVNKSEMISRLGCGLAIPVAVQAGQRVVVRSVALNAKGTLNAGSSVRVSAEAFVPGLIGNKAERSIVADRKLSGRFLVSGQDLISGRCGESTILRLNTSVLLNRNNSLLSSKIALTAATLELDTEACDSSAIEGL